MNIVVRKEELIEKLELKREQHIAVLEIARRGYMDAVLSDLKKLKKKIKEGKEVDRWHDRSFPSSHVEAYDDAIAMVRLDEGDTVELNTEDFRRFVLDKWEWKSTLIGLANGYLAYNMDVVGYAVDSDTISAYAS